MATPRLHCPQAALESARCLRAHGHRTYLVGGAVRDFLLGRPWTDADLVCDAAPIDIYRIFPRAQIVGTRQPVVMVPMQGRMVEVTSLNAAGAGPEPLARLHADALQRDFTVNALYADPFSGMLLDPAGGRADLARGLLRTVVPAGASLAADPVRILRGVRIGAACGMAIEPALLAAMRASAWRLARQPPQRISRECGKMLAQCPPAAWLSLLRAAGLDDYLLRPPLRAAGDLARPLPALPGVKAPGKAITLLVNLLLEATRSARDADPGRCPADAVDDVLASVQAPFDAAVQVLGLALHFWLRQTLSLRPPEGARTVCPQS